MTIILFLVVLAVLIFAHELGHFLVAKKSGIRVDEFAIGFPPKIFSWVRGETKYVLNLIPFGGYVKIFGENPDEESMTGSDSKRSFVNAPKWKQSCVLLAGISFNIIFAWILISISFMFGSIVPIGEGSAQYSKYITDERVIVTQTMPNTPAALAGLTTGDSILKVTSGKESFDMPNVQKIQEVITTTQGSIVLVYKRGEVEKSEVLVPKEIDGKKVVGIYMENVGVVRLNPFLALWEGGKLTLLTFKQVIVGLVTFIFQAVRGQGDFSQVSGPVGIVSMVGDAATFGLAYFLGFVAFISLNLAAINLVPFPALDGGRVLFVIIEAIIRRPIKPKIANTVNAVGFFILISLMIIITYRDIMKFF
jgi:regulator of sigma E protease